MNNVQIAERIKLICKQKNHSLQNMLAVCGLNKGFIYDLEKKGSMPSADKFFKLADYLNCSVDYLLGRTELPEQSELTPQEEKLLSNNRNLDEAGKEKLLDYSDDLVNSGKHNLKTAFKPRTKNYQIAAYGGDFVSSDEDKPQVT